jgi:hypothetical protein
VEFERPVAQPRWSNASFLLYAGGLIVLGAAVEALTQLGRDYSDVAFVGWAALVFGVFAAFALLFRRIGSWIAGGIFAFSAVAGWGVLVGALERWFGWLPHETPSFSGFHAGLLLLALFVLAGALVALRSFRFPLLVGPVVAACWYFATDLVSGGGNGSAVVALVVGLVLFRVARAVDAGAARPYGFWLHVAAGVAVAGALLWFWHSSDTDWALVAVAGILYIWVAEVVKRSSYAVLGAYGLYLVATHFADKWSRAATSLLDVLPYLFLTPFLGFGSDLGGVTPRGGRDWAAPLTFAFLGFVLVGIGLLLERRHARTMSTAARGGWQNAPIVGPVA